MIKIGIDSATHKTGFAIIENDKYVSSMVIDTSFSKLSKPYEFANYGDKLAFSSIKASKDIYKVLRGMDLKNKKIVLGLEMTEIPVGRLSTQKLNYFTGIYISIVANMVYEMGGRNMVTKIISPDQWASLVLNITTATQREARKELSKARASKIAGKNIESDDEADAINIADAIDKLKDYKFVKYQVAYKQKMRTSLRSKIATQEAIIKKKEALAHQRFINTPMEKRKEHKIEHLTKQDYGVWLRAKEKLAEFKQEREKLND